MKRIVFIHLYFIVLIHQNVFQNIDYLMVIMIVLIIAI